MPLVLSGTDGVSGVDGTASNPSYEGTDSNTGIFYPAADTVAIGTGGTEALRVNSSQNVGIGTSSPATKLQVQKNGKAFQLYDASTNDGTYMVFAGSNLTKNWCIGNQFNVNGALEFTQTSATGGTTIASTPSMVLDSSGNVGIGTSSPSYKIESIGATPAYFGSNSTDGTRIGYASALPSNSVNCFVGWVPDTVGGINGDLALCPRTSTGAKILFFTGTTTPTERARITSDGYFKATQSSYLGATGAYHEFSWNTANSMFFYHTSTTAGNAYGLEVRYKSTPNGTGNAFLGCYDTDGTAQRFTARSNGGLANYSANNVNLSDRREKTNFAPAKNYLDVICAIPVQTFNYIDQNMEDDPGETLGVVAQDVQAVAPELVMESNWGTAEEPKMRLSIYQTDLQYALMKCIQELKAELDATKAEIQALKGNA